jgi:CO/xanthine dehydrogenase FAD-binding subunit
VDITRLGWPPVTVRDDGIELAATCTVADVSRLSSALVRDRPDWTAAPLLHQCCTALLASFKIWSTATVGGNIALALPAGSMTSLASALDAELTVWRSDGTDARLAVTEFVTGPGANAMAPDDVLRSVWLPAAALRSMTAYRKLAPSPVGRSGVVVIGRRDTDADGGGFTVSVTAATVRPCVFGFAGIPTATELAAAHAGIDAQEWTVDAHGDPDWRRAVTLVLAEQIRGELA